MHQEHSFKTAACSDYERLLATSQKALENWRVRREQVAISGLTGRQVAAELLSLQADFAKAYSRLEKHEGQCEICAFVSKIGGHDIAGISDSSMDRKCPV
jgi:hypothetical protein